MKKARELARRLKEATSERKLEELVLKIVKEDEAYLTGLNKLQLFESLDSQGEPLGEYSSLAYANKKGRITVDLKLTGDFYDGFFIDTSELPIAFDSRDSKTELLVKKYGKEIFGLSEEHLKVYIRGRFKTRFQDYFRSLFRI